MTLPRRTVLKDSAIALPRPALLSDSAVARSVWSSAGSAAARTYLAPPTAGAELVITVRGGVPNMFVIGPRTAATWKSTRDLSATATLNLRPGVLRALFGVSAVDLRDAAVPAHELLGRALVDRALDLTTRSTTHAALGVVRWLEEAASRARVPATLVAVLDRAAHASPRDLARHIGVSARTLHRMLVEHLGIAPRDLVRIARSRRLLAHLGRGEALAQTAFACGYADQAHMTNDARTLFGRTPAAIARDAASALIAPG